LATATRIWSALSPRTRTAAAVLLLAVSTLPLLSRQYIGKTQSDLSVYMHGIEALLQGRLYDGHIFEYPPYALIWFLAPYAWAPDDLQGFRFAFGLEIWLFDAAIKAVLLWRAFRTRSGFPDLIPFLVYSLGSAALGHLLLMRYDAIPGALALFGVLALAGGYAVTGGALTMLAAGTKAYPALFIPILAIAAWRRGPSDFRRFVVGVAAAGAPLLLLAAWMPWWNFASFHGTRGLEVESFAASVIWALHHVAGVDATWSLVGTSNELGGPLADALLGPARILWIVSTLAAFGVAILSTLRMTRSTGQTTAPAIAMQMLLTVLAFVATNIVLSPQFHLWLIPLAALMLEGRRNLPPQAVRAAWLTFLATLLVPAFVPHKQFGAGLGGPLTAVLLLRNTLLLYATACLARAAFAILSVSAPSQKPDHEGVRSQS